MYVSDIPDYINHCTTYFLLMMLTVSKPLTMQPSDCALTQADLTWNDNLKLAIT